MKALTKLAVTLILGLSLVCSLPGAKAAGKKKRPQIQMAILLDTSSSMNGLIDQAKTQLWKVVNEFITSKKSGLRPTIEVALYEYGKSSIPKGENYLRMITPLTTDLDKVSEELFALRTNGGQEYCGTVIQAATGGLKWSKSNKDLKVIFIAGNEPFTQGPVDYRKAVKEAISKGIIVNTIHCGTNQAGISGKWKDGALLADGRFLNIDQNRKVLHIAAPQDKEIARLGQEMNKTYIGFGSRGKKAKMRQAAQDSNASSAAKGSMAQRAVYKSSGNYSNAGWDLVDAEKEGKVKVEEMAEEELPAEMKKIDKSKRKEYVAGKRKERAKIQKKIKKLNAERKKFVAKKRKEMSKAGGQDTLDSAMIKTVREQATKKNFKFE
ncbi:MAG: VWA domain-containing protein [Deltaproteobacteria bacterium]|nr:VWA domain-containing protein [Deltaproteobacteria bacterium]